MQDHFNKLQTEHSKRLQDQQTDHNKVVDKVLDEKVKQIDKYRKQVGQMQMDLVQSKTATQSQLNQTFSAEGYATQTFNENKDLRSEVSKL